MPPVPLIYNPKAGDGAGFRHMERARALLAARGIETDTHPTAGPGGASHLAEKLAGEGHKLILVVGGDGTHSEAVDGVMRSGKRPTLGLLPGGTANSFLLDFGLNDLEKAVERVAAGKPRDFDVAHVTWDGGERWFFNVFGIGFMADVASFANRRLKWMGHTAYTVGVFPILARLRCPVTRITLDGEVVEGPFSCVSVCNTIHAGGAMKFAPDAKGDDGVLDVVGLRKTGRFRLVQIFTKIFEGKHVEEPEVFVARAREVKLEPAIDGPLLGDGEIYGTTPCTIKVQAGALSLLV